MQDAGLTLEQQILQAQHSKPPDTTNEHTQSIAQPSLPGKSAGTSE